jgi:Xaa-Pro dipeptidase
MRRMDWLPVAQAALRAQGLAAWWIYDFRGNNPVAARFHGMPDAHFSRRVVLAVPAEGTPDVAGARHRARRRRARALAGAHLRRPPGAARRARERSNPGGPVALEYAPEADLPYVSHVDAGTIELLRAVGVDVRSSAEVLQAFATWTPAQVAAHERAAEAVMAVATAPSTRSAAGSRPARPCASTRCRPGSPRASPSAAWSPATTPSSASARTPATRTTPRSPASDRALAEGEVVLIDLWAKEDRPDAPYADVTWMGVAANRRPRSARLGRRARRPRPGRAASSPSATPPATRRPAGRSTAPCATTSPPPATATPSCTAPATASAPATTHGEAAHLDDFETRDVRRLTPGFGITVEPGVYLPSFGVRSELNVLLEADGPRVTTGVQPSWSGCERPSGADRAGAPARPRGRARLGSCGRAPGPRSVHAGGGGLDADGGGRWWSSATWSGTCSSAPTPRC